MLILYLLFYLVGYFIAWKLIRKTLVGITTNWGAEEAIAVSVLATFSWVAVISILAGLIRKSW